MATYCIGDLHGQYELFHGLLQKINFDPTSDQLYILGDTIDGHYGGIKIIDYLMNHTNSCTLIMGNHEHYFLYMEQAYDAVMLNPAVKEAMIAAVEVYSENLFSLISNIFERKLHAKSRDAFYEQAAIKKWLAKGDFRVRSKLLRIMIDLAERCNFNKELYKHAKSILSSLSGHFRTKAFVKELLEQTTECYISIKNYLKNCPDTITLNFAGTNYCLMHSKYSTIPLAWKFEMPGATTTNITYIFGHEPTPLLHRKIQGGYNSFPYSYRNIYSWIDTNNNRFFNLDLSSNPIVALKLDDMSEYYVGNPSNRKSASKWEVPKDIVAPPSFEYHYVDYARIGSHTFHNTAFITKRNRCYEFLIGISAHSNTIYYARINWFDFIHEFSITDWFSNHSEDEIIKKVHEDFEKQLKSSETEPIGKWLQVISTEE